MKVRELKDSNIFAIEREGERFFIEDLFALEDCGESVSVLDEDTLAFKLFDMDYRLTDIIELPPGRRPERSGNEHM